MAGVGSPAQSQMSLFLEYPFPLKSVYIDATNQLNFLRRNLSKCSSDVKSLAYTSDSFDHSSSMLLQPGIHILRPTSCKFEAMQRRAAHFALISYDRYNTSVTGLIKQLVWDTLETRRTANRLNVFYKALHNIR